MVRSIIRYIILTAIVIGIVLLMGSLINKDEKTEFNSSKGNNQINYYTASIKILDKETKKFISGGKFILKNSKDEIVDEWIGTENIHRSTKLKNGTYTIEQTSPIDGYNKTEEVSFKIYNSNKDVDVYNEAHQKEVISSNEVNVDNTLSVRCFLSYVVALTIIGCGLILIVNKKYKFN